MEFGKNHLTLIGILLVLVILVFGVILLFGPEGSGVYSVLSEIDGELMDKVYQEYDILRQTVSPIEAREQLLESLNSDYRGVDFAELGLDGYTIFVNFSDGEFAAIDTFELDEDIISQPTPGILGENQGISGETPAPNHMLRFDGPSQPASLNQYPYSASFNIIVVGPQEEIVPMSRKVLVLGPCYWEFSKQPVLRCIESFKDQGWTGEDIDVKVVEYLRDPEFLSIKPEDFFNLADYGIILFTGHGTAKVHHGFNESEIYLQFCYLSDAQFEEDRRLREWHEQKKLLVTSKYLCKDKKNGKFFYGTVIRGDLLKENLDVLPGSYLYLSTCYGAYFNSIFLEKGATVFLGWNWVVHGPTSDSDMLNISRLMLEDGKSAFDAFMDDTVTREYQRYPDEPRVNLYVLPDPARKKDAKYFYFPSWIDLTLTSIPDNTDFVEVSIYDGETLLVKDMREVETGESEVLLEDAGELVPPFSEFEIKVSAFDEGAEELASGKTSVDALDIGPNSLQIDLSSTTDITFRFDLDPEKEGQLDVRKDRTLGIEARLDGRPDGELLFVWETDAQTDEGLLGGFGPLKAQQLETSDSSVQFFPNKIGSDGIRIPVRVSVYLVQESGNRLIGKGETSLDLYNPTTLHSLVDEEGRTGGFYGSGGDWNIDLLGHGPIFGSGFYARSGEQIRFVCKYKGYYPEWEHPSVYLKQGDTMTYLFSIDEIPDQLDQQWEKIVTIP